VKRGEEGMRIKVECGDTGEGFMGINQNTKN
jgi:hypothetical protein